MNSVCVTITGLASSNRLNVDPFMDEYDEVKEPRSSPSKKSNLEPLFIRFACSANLNKPKYKINRY